MTKYIRGCRAKNAIPDKEVVEIIRQRIAETEPDYMLLWFDMAIATGFRVADVCQLRFSGIDYRRGSITTTPNKEFNSKRAAVVRRVISQVRKEQMLVASKACDYKKYHDVSQAALDDLMDCNVERRINRELVGIVHVESESMLPINVLDRLVLLRATNQRDDFIFSRSMVSSNRAKNKDGCLTRQTIWKRLRTVLDWYSEEHDSTLKLSATSTRKTTIYEALRINPEKTIRDYRLKSKDNAMEIVNLPSPGAICTSGSPIQHLEVLMSDCSFGQLHEGANND